MSIRGKRVLIVEDDFLIAEDLANCIRLHGGVIEGPVPTVEQALATLSKAPLDFAVLDIRLGPDDVFPLADALSEQGTPFVFATGVDGAGIPSHHSGIPIISKPFSADALLSFIVSGIAPREALSSNALLACFPETALRKMRPHALLVPLTKGKTLLRAGKPSERALFPTSGLCSLLLGPPDDLVEVAVIGHEGLVAPLNFQTPSPFEVRVEAPGLAIAILHQQLKELVHEDARVAALLLDYAYALGVHIAETAASASASCVPARLARLLLICSDRIGPDLPFVHDLLSMRLNVRRAGVTEALHMLEGEKVIRARRGAITIIDVEKLRAIAGWPYGQAEAIYSRLSSQEEDSRCGELPTSADCSPGQRSSRAAPPGGARSLSIGTMRRP